MQASYTKLRDGSWGVRVQGQIAAGAKISVAKKDGSTKTEPVERVLWSDNGATIVSIARQEPSYDRGSSRSSVERTYMRKYGWDRKRGSSSYYSSGMYDEES